MYKVSMVGCRDNREQGARKKDPWLVGCDGLGSHFDLKVSGNLLKWVVT